MDTAFPQPRRALQPLRPFRGRCHIRGRGQYHHHAPRRLQDTPQHTGNGSAGRPKQKRDQRSLWCCAGELLKSGIKQISSPFFLETQMLLKSIHVGRISQPYQQKSFL